MASFSLFRRQTATVKKKHTAILPHPPPPRNSFCAGFPPAAREGRGRKGRERKASALPNDRQGGSPALPGPRHMIDAGRKPCAPGKVRIHTRHGVIEDIIWWHELENP